MALLDYIRVLNAAQKFKIKDGFEFLSFDDLTSGEPVQPPDEFEIFAKIKIEYDGELPESNRALNVLIGDWVDRNMKPLTETIHKKLLEYFKTHHPDSDRSALEQTEETAVWDDQSDFLPEIDEDKKTITVELELVLHGEPLE